MSSNNPARRLHQLLTKACEIGSSQNNRAVTSSWVWSRTFEFKEDDHVTLNSHAEAFYGLLSQTRKTIKKLPVDDHSPYFQSIDAISATFSKHGFFSAQWGSLGNTFQGGATMAMLLMTADAIDRDVDLVGLTQEQLKELIESTKALLDDVVGSELNEDLKSYLVVHQEEILSSIRHYCVSGRERLRRVLSANIGGALLKSIGLGPKEQKRAPWRKFLSLILKFGGLLGLASDADGYLLPKLEDLVKLLPPSPE